MMFWINLIFEEVCSNESTNIVIFFDKKEKDKNKYFLFPEFAQLGFISSFYLEKLRNEIFYLKLDFLV